MRAARGQPKGNRMIAAHLQTAMHTHAEIIGALVAIAILIAIVARVAARRK